METTAQRMYQSFNNSFIDDINCYISNCYISRVQAIIYSKSMASLYIIKNGFDFPTPVGDVFLSLFVAFIVMSCNGPAVQYLQVAHLLSS